MKSSPKKLFLFGIVIILMGVLLAFLKYFHVYPFHQKFMSLEEALWVCDEDFQNFYPPGSPESIKMVKSLKPYINKNMKCYMLYRKGVSASSDPDTPIMWEPFDPSMIPDYKSGKYK